MEQNNKAHDYYNSTDYLLYYNLNMLSAYPIAQYNNMLQESTKLKEDKERLKEDKEKLQEDKNNLEKEKEKLQEEKEKLNNDVRIIKRKLFSTEKLLDDEIYKRSKSDTEVSNNENLFKRYEIYKYRLNKFSYNKEEINNLFKSINSINDIIALKDKWQCIKHNDKLQRFYHLIPALENLNAMIGLKQVKEDVFMKIIYYTMNPYNEEYLHTQISGPPGVGKTEFAKIYADIFLRLGILKNDSFTEIKRDDLIGKYLGQTAPKTRELLEKGMGGVIFLDEAYSLGNEDKRDSFSKEAIDMINQYLSEKKNEFMFIIAGYEEDCEKCFFAYNKGLKRRFSSHYRIESYTSLELKNIFIGKINKKYNLFVTDEELLKFFEKNKDSFIHFGGDIEKFYNEIKYTHCYRIFKESKNSKELNESQNMQIILKDLEISLSRINDKKIVEFIKLINIIGNSFSICSILF